MPGPGSMRRPPSCPGTLRQTLPGRRRRRRRRRIVGRPAGRGFRRKSILVKLCHATRPLSPAHEFPEPVLHVFTESDIYRVCPTRIYHQQRVCSARIYHQRRVCSKCDSPLIAHSRRRRRRRRRRRVAVLPAVFPVARGVAAEYASIRVSDPSLRSESPIRVSDPSLLLNLSSKHRTCLTYPGAVSDSLRRLKLGY